MLKILTTRVMHVAVLLDDYGAKPYVQFAGGLIASLSLQSHLASELRLEIF